jgi:ribosomal protein L37AE/L43A
MLQGAATMKRFLLGEDSRFLESVVGEITMVVFVTTLSGIVFSLAFLINQSVAPVLLKFALIATVGIVAGFLARRLMVVRNRWLRFLTGLFAVIIALGVLNVITRGFIGINLLRAYPTIPAWDGALQFGLGSLFVWLSQRAWTGVRREIMVEPRGEVPVISAAPRPRAPRARTRSRVSAFTTWREKAVSRVQAFISPPTTRPKKRKLPAKAPRRSIRRPKAAGIALTSAEEHVCPYCLEEVKNRDPRGVKVCKVCKTWHHGDCWAVTGVCQVPHQYAG